MERIMAYGIMGGNWDDEHLGSQEGLHLLRAALTMPGLA